MIKKFDDFFNEHVSINPNGTPIQKRLRVESENLEKEIEEIKNNPLISEKDKKIQINILKDEILHATNAYYNLM